MEVENDKLKEVLHDTELELEKYKLEKQTESESLYVCSKCGSNFKSYKILKQHIRSERSQCRATQKDKDGILEEYPCYYCDRVIVSTNDLEMHGRTCHVEIRVKGGVEFSCDICGVKSRYEKD